MVTKIQVIDNIELGGHKQGIYALQYSHGFMWSVGGDGYVVKWDINSGNGELFAQIPEPIFCLKVVSEFAVLVGTQKGQVFLLEKGQQARAWKVSAQGIFFIEQVGEKFWVGLGDGRLMVFDQQFEVEKIMAITRNQESLRCVLLGPGIGLVERVDGLFGQERDLLDEESGQIGEGRVILDKQGDLQEAASEAGPDSNSVWLGASDGCVYEVDSQSYEILSKRIANQPSVFSMDWDLTSTPAMISGGRDAQLKRFDIQHQTESVIPAHWYSIHQVKRHPQYARFLASSSMDKSLKLWELPQLDLIKVIDRPKIPMAHTHSVNALCWLPSESPTILKLASGSDDKRLVIWTLEIS